MNGICQRQICIRKIELYEVGMLTYTLWETELPDGRQYGMTVSLQGALGYEKKSIQDITTDKQQALNLFWKISRGTVTPCTLAEVLSELLA